MLITSHLETKFIAIHSKVHSKVHREIRNVFIPIFLLTFLVTKLLEREARKKKLVSYFNKVTASKENGKHLAKTIQISSH